MKILYYSQVQNKQKTITKCRGDGNYELYKL